MYVWCDDWWLHWWILMSGESECYKWLHTVLCFWCRPKTKTCTTHMPTQMFVSVIYRCRQITPSIGISTRYRYRSRPKVSVSEVSVNCGIGLTLFLMSFSSYQEKNSLQDKTERILSIRLSVDSKKVCGFESVSDRTLLPSLQYILACLPSVSLDCRRLAWE